MNLSFLYTTFHAPVRWFFRLIFLVTCQGRGNIPKTGGVVVSGNHTSNFDAPFIGAFFSRQMKFLSKEELFKSPFAGWFLKGIGAIPIKRGASEIGILKLLIALLKEGGCISIFPEGTRTHVELEDVKSGAVLFAIKAQVPIQPVRVIGSYKLFRPVKIIFGQPKYYTEYYGQRLSQQQLHELAVELMKEIYALA
jgi:1-acyl-sn-glycerol-3-phosphate acyltransferase